MAKSVEQKPVKSPEERRKIVAKEAAELAKGQGLNWKDLPREQRHEFKQQARQNRAARREARQEKRAAKMAEGG